MCTVKQETLDTISWAIGWMIGGSSPGRG